VSPRREIRVARLRKERIGEYRDLHDRIPRQNVKHMTEAGFTDLRIFLLDDLLIMITEQDPTLAVPGRTIDERAEEEWREKSGRCFETLWQDATMIFDLQDARK